VVFTYIEIHATVQALVMDGINVLLQEFAVFIIFNVMEDFEVYGKQQMTGVTNRIVNFIDRSQVTSACCVFIIQLLC